MAFESDVIRHVGGQIVHGILAVAWSSGTIHAMHQPLQPWRSAEQEFPKAAL